MVHDFDEALSCTHDPKIFDVLVIYLKPGDEIFWKLCNASSIPGDALAVDKSGEGELLFLGYIEGKESIVNRLGYVRAGKGLMHHHVRNREDEEEKVTRWEVSEGIWVLCARKNMFA